ncbi:MAG: carboxylate-amine ligase [Phycisphaerales bacterium]|nr:carboxylate-amine ligase [Phycisphaerales bacterium]
MGHRNFKQFTVGIEEEYMVLQPVTRELISHEQKIVIEGQKIFQDKVKAEMHQAVIEVGTSVCQDVGAAYEDLKNLRKSVSTIANQLGFNLGASGTHPFSHWEKQLITDHERYNAILKEMQEAARSNLIFGLHVHVGMENRELAVHIANVARYFLPHVFALSTNSPFWEGRNTGYKSFRTKVFDKFPRTGIPEDFIDLNDYNTFIALLVKTKCIDNGRKIWWDLRVHPNFNTVEFRICDVPLTAKESVALAALFQAICAKLYYLREQNLTFINYHRSLIMENKWRASRYGLDGKLIDFGKEEEFPTKQLILELLDFVDDMVDPLNSRQEIEYIKTILEEGTGADKQLKIYDNNPNNMHKLVDYITSVFNN